MAIAPPRQYPSTPNLACFALSSSTACSSAGHTREDILGKLTALALGYAKKSRAGTKESRLVRMTQVNLKVRLSLASPVSGVGWGAMSVIGRNGSIGGGFAVCQPLSPRFLHGMRLTDVVRHIDMYAELVGELIREDLWVRLLVSTTLCLGV